jgi:murein DD-endopeptidase MepM/ murein hydrolase activator NlpD
MVTGSGAGSGWRAVASVAFAVLLAGCGQAPRPAPLVGVRPPATITVERGQTLSGIAVAYHVPMRELAELNHLSPPYKILAGGELLLPSTATVRRVAAMPAAPVPAAETTTVAGSAPSPPRSPPPSPQMVRSAALTPPEPTSSRAPPAANRVQPPASAAAPGPPPSSALPASVETGLPAARGAFVWPVRGHIVEGYGAGSDGTHNDGINISAPRDSPVEAAGGGVIAYAGNELRGYGNLILIKHPDGWISAYAHLDLILVKEGEKVAKGQVIARVGSTGNVRTPQLHFELRRGDKPVDPRAYLPPLPSAADRPASSG